MQRLTALWALGESGLGGMMHALHMPFTGIFVGGFAVLIIGLIAHYSSNAATTLLQSTMLVILVKAAVSPQSPPPAYIAVAFQGLLGALLSRTVSHRATAAILLGTLSMLESALQKLLMTTLIFGKSIWIAIDQLGHDILQDFHLSSGISISIWLISIYLIMFLLWGVLLGIWIIRLPRLIAHHQAGIWQQYHTLIIESKVETNNKKHSIYRKILPTLLILISVAAILYISPGGGINKAIYVIVRTIAMLALLIVVVQPLLKWLLNRWINKKQSSNRQAVQDLLDIMPQLRSYVSPAYQIAGSTHKGIKKYSTFILILIVLSLGNDK